MAVITNFGTMSYDRNGVSENLNSNTVQTNLNVSYTSNMLKAASPSKFSPSQRITYQVYFRNTGTGTFYNPVITDNLGGDYDSPLDYVPNSAAAFLYNNEGTQVSEMAVTEMITDENAVFNISGNIPQGYSLILTFNADVSADDVLEITNTAVFTADKGNSAASAKAPYTDSASATIIREPVSIVKSASADSVNPGDTLTYTFTLTNVSKEDITVNAISDKLPANFKTDDNIIAIIGDDEVIYTKGTDFTVSDSNELIISPDTPLTIPAATCGTAGITTVSISGTITA